MVLNKVAIRLASIVKLLFESVKHANLILFEIVFVLSLIKG